MWKKAKEKLYAVIYFTEAAKYFGVGGNINKKIFLMSGKYFAGQTYDYTEAQVKELERARVPVIDLTEGLERPKETFFIPSEKIISGRIELARRGF